jgi:serine/threonine-protein kinase RsbW
VHLQVAVCLPRDSSTVALVRGVVADALATFGVTADCVYDVRLALSEACTNVIDHAADDDEYEVRLSVDERQCAITVENTRTAFDAGSLAGVMPDEDSPRGRGVAMMRALMDRVDFRSEPARGTIVHLVKTLDVAPGSPLATLRNGPDPASRA